MPSTSAKQAKFMRAVSHSPKFAKKVGVSQSVGKDFEMADKKTKKFGTGGDIAAKPKPKPPLKEAPGNNDPYEPMPPKLKPEPRKPLGPSGKKGYKEGGTVRKNADKTGITKQLPTAKEMGNMNMAKGAQVKSKMADKAGRALVKKSADTMGRAMKMNKGGKCYAKGGSIDGIAKKGKTKGKM